MKEVYEVLENVRIVDLVVVGLSYDNQALANKITIVKMVPKLMENVISFLTKDYDFTLVTKANEPCGVCFHAKQTCCSLSQSESKICLNSYIVIFEEPIEFHLLFGVHYFFTIVDVARRVVWVYLICDESKACMLL